MKEYQGRIFAGFLIISIGILFLLGTMDVIDPGDVIGDFWPLILIFIGLGHILGSASRNKLGGIILLLIGLFFLLNNLDIIDTNLWNYVWPLAIILVGIWLITHPFISGRKTKATDGQTDDLDVFVMFSGLERRIKSQAFKGGKASVVFGGIELDFKEAGLASDQATIDVSALFGGIEIWVPREWKVIVEGRAIFGAVEDKHRSLSPEAAKATLIVKASATFGGVEVKN